MVFSNKKILLFLNDKFLSLYSKELQEEDRIQFPAKVYSDSKLHDPDKFKELIVESLAKINLKKQHAVLCLGDGPVFEKESVIKEEMDEEVLQEQFERNNPFEPSQTIKLRLSDGNTLKLIAADREVIEGVIDAVQVFEWNVDQVVPALLFSESGNTPTKDSFERILKSESLLKEGNLLDRSPDTVKKGSPKGNVASTLSFRVVVLVGLIILIIAALLIARTYLNTVKNTPQKDSPDVSLPSLPSSITASASASPTASVALLDKDQITAEVLNGTGKAGQAAQVRTMLEDLGYQNIVIGNSTKSASDSTIVEKTASVSADLTSEIVSSLQKSFSSVSVEQVTNGKFDIVITTGK